jgi:septum formation protein
MLVARLAEAKARSIAVRRPNALVIGSDQAAVLDGKILGKPGSHERAVEQLLQASGQTVIFYTGLCVMDSDSGRAQVDIAPFRVVFRKFGLPQIENYLRREQPYQCAGSFKSEGLGIALFERLDGDDPTSLIGLPLIRLVRMLETEGVAIL